MAKFLIVGKKMRFTPRILLIALVLTLTQCMSYDFARRVVQQGNLLPQDKIARLHVGMSKEDVAILMGTSLLSPTFNNDRWDYAYTWQRGNSIREIRNIVLYFRHDRLTRIDHMP
ncbi:small protein A [Legionella busanensis]|uniref:Outer membrane protein assembly factor BamE n=1 Tax=Legionella busanensis TaxID=190655 RepID=A0A378JGL0_9GAMM|nr:outer membrane protein assembly factor BamE [Legionella busanensis]STX50305.1 small protein A [Legionella busanensis]